jgi:hypothetical protein
VPEGWKHFQRLISPVEVAWLPFVFARGDYAEKG